MTANPLKFYQTLNLPPRSVKRHGQYWRAGAPLHRHSAGRADHGAGRSDQDGPLVSAWSNQVTFGPVVAVFTFESASRAVSYAGIRTGEIVGHRLWWLVMQDGEPWLCSLAHRRLWQPAETVHGDLNEVVDCSFLVLGGVYAYREQWQCELEAATAEKEALQYLEATRKRMALCMIGWHPFMETYSFVRGTVKMWGEVIEHQHGYRAQFAKLHSLDQLYGDGDLEALRAKYFPV